MKAAQMAAVSTKDTGDRVDDTLQPCAGCSGLVRLTKNAHVVASLALGPRYYHERCCPCSH